jgi:hypothetical protein
MCNLHKNIKPLNLKTNVFFVNRMETLVSGLGRVGSDDDPLSCAAGIATPLGIVIEL